MTSLKPGLHLIVGKVGYGKTTLAKNLLRKNSFNYQERLYISGLVAPTNNLHYVSLVLQALQKSKNKAILIMDDYKYSDILKLHKLLEECYWNNVCVIIVAQAWLENSKLEFEKIFIHHYIDGKPYRYLVCSRYPNNFTGEVIMVPLQVHWKWKKASKKALLYKTLNKKTHEDLSREILDYNKIIN